MNAKLNVVVVVFFDWIETTARSMKGTNVPRIQKKSSQSESPEVLCRGALAVRAEYLLSVSYY